jgi:hypothetical protein
MPDKKVYEKLNIKTGSKVKFVNPPADYLDLIGGLPEGAVNEALNAEPVDQVIVFANNRSELEKYAPVWSELASNQTQVWIVYHKGTSKTKTDINRDSINSFANSISMQGVAMVSINDDWSALRLKKA